MCRADAGGCEPGGRRVAPASRLLLLIIAGYRRLISPLLPPSCRFVPSCSQYAAEAVRRHGPLRGVLMAASRLLRCHPFQPGGYDPVR